MRETKTAEERKNEILDVAEQLFNSKGYDATSTNDILKALGIARGTLYHHFDSKEAIMDGIIHRYNQKIFVRVKNIIDKKDIHVIDRLLMAFSSLNISEETTEEVMTQVHQPQNALMHQKIYQVLIQEIIPLFVPLIEEGVAEDIFHTAYPYGSIEMLIVYAVTIFDNQALTLPPEEENTRINAFVFNVERILGTQPTIISQRLLPFLTKE